MSETKRTRQPAMLAAGVTIELGKLELAIANLKKRLAEKESEHAAIFKGLTPDVRTLVERLRGKSA